MTQARRRPNRKAPAKDWDTVAALYSWIAEQDPTEEPPYHDPQDCLLYRYMRAQGINVYVVGGNYYVPEESMAANRRNRHRPLPRDLADIAEKGGPTFGGYLTYIAKEYPYVLSKP